ncbi:hypothetical protein SEA_YABOI_33 [Streptomyces phage Yaboi]|jgi:hypothetical protein|uniref:Uncharacterized protein n=3 Tax=Streptomyces virus Yaboi TaxID=2846408 RepID=A0A385UGJ0_9CAUD|nr:hypothetical protein HWB86_gp033 [Streptomyces phage Yaboi]QAY08694.1 hypothetical protein SEA_GENIE2_32 [Streptomyces phage Genie2]QAY12684.1 hypothetical protein SEA_BOOMERJR_32 [Streptomyces phage BoomerJR]UVD39880.1 hypothetical protein SEA_STANIMAL_32 [Streptomyces phage Stanimal]WNM73621.1 hypothetical protein SEA_SOLLERTIA_32 [Streptomyces phage Sollertia]AYB70872.1 hypothetical protein SEA_YABOI_33 [Streptomyces phage Yaboi]
MVDFGVRRALNNLREQRRNQARAFEKARRSGDQLGMKRAQREIKRLDGEIENLSG